MINNWITVSSASNTIRNVSFALALGSSAILVGCSGPGQTLSHGYQVSQDTLDLVPVGSSREQVLLSLGTPSTTTEITGSETYYYISQTKKRGAAFMTPKLVTQKVLAIYFAKDDTVSNIGNYGLKDGKVFDFISRTTPTGGKDLSFLGQILGAAGNVPNPLGTSRPRS